MHRSRLQDTPRTSHDFLKFADDRVLQQLRAIKHENKVRFAKYAYAKTGVKIDNHRPDMIKHA